MHFGLPAMIFSYARSVLPLCLLLALIPSVSTAFEVRDSNFQQCLNDIGKKKSWVKPEEFLVIKCHSAKIESVEGIAQFSNVESVSLHKNNIREIRLPSLTKLKTLNIARNKIEHLVIADQPQLEKLYLFDSATTTLHIENLPKLKLLKANNNNLIKFTYSLTPSLEKIYIFDNQLEHVDIYSLEKLAYMDCRQNPMPDPLYEEMDAMRHVTFLHDGNADDW